MNDTRMPALYIGHGAPPLLDDPVWSGQLAAWAGDLPRPKAILIVSAHWESAPISLSASRCPVRRADPRMPSCSLATGGLITRTWRRPDGAPLSSTSSTGAPMIRSASWAGFAIVAEAQMKTGSDP